MVKELWFSYGLVRKGDTYSSKRLGLLMVRETLFPKTYTRLVNFSSLIDHKTFLKLLVE